MSPRKSILIIEDDADSRDVMREVLDLNGYSVFTASNGQEGANLLETMPNPPGVILLDLMMPVMNGWQFLDYQRGNPKFRTIPIVICSAYEASAKAIDQKRYLPKPVVLDRLLNAVKAFCD
jgi:two-component system response regulator CpxR